MTHKYGEPWAAEFATAHERHRDSHHIPVAMDLHNHEVGRKINRGEMVGHRPERHPEVVQRSASR
jgi:hypothetical protein